MRAATTRSPADDRATAVDEPRRCLWLTKGLGRGGVERLLVDMQPLVDSTRYRVDVAYLLPWKDSYHGALEEGGATVTCLGGRSGARDPRWVARLATLIRRGGYDVVHTHAPVAAVAARLVTMGRGRPALVHTEHNLWSRYRWPTRITNSATYQRNRAVIAVSDSVAASIQPVARRRRPTVETVLHGTKLGSIRSLVPDDRRAGRSALGLPPHGFVVGTVGNLTAKKDHRSLLEAMAGPGPISEAQLVIVGTGPLRAELEAAASELGVADRTHFLGNRDDVFDLLPLFDVFCLSSQFEGFPIALVEAMATGLPCVATAVGGIPEILRSGENGLLVEAGEPHELRAGIEQLMTAPDDAARYGIAARDSASVLDLATAVDRTLRVYDRALDNGA